MNQHFIITRFNLRKQGWNTTREKTQVLTDAWMENRLNLFEQFCYPSVRAQTQQNFTWLVFFDTKTAAKYKKRIHSLALRFPQFKPKYIDGMDEFLPSIKGEIGNLLHKPYLITSRLDNDDCLHEDYVKTIQGEFARQDFMAIDIIDGLTLQIEPRVRLGRRRHVNNPFISLIERADNFASVWSRERHGEWKKVSKIKTIQNHALWLSIIHKENKANDFLGFGDLDWTALNPFHLDKDLSKKRQKEQIPYQSWKAEALKNQFRTQWKVFFKLLQRRF